MGIIGTEPRVLFGQFESESDRGVVMILGSLLEDGLLNRLVKEFQSLSAAQLKNLTRSGGLLSGFEQRIALAHALGVIDQETADDLQVIKAMRNACAHSRFKIDFLTPQLKEAFALLISEDAGAQNVRRATSASLLRQVFIIIFTYLYSIINGTRRDVAQLLADSLFEGLKRDVNEALEKQQASLEKRKRRRAERLQPNPKG